MTNYSRGATKEREVVDWFRAQGYEARRTAGSHGPFDVMAINANEIVLVQVKLARAVKRAPRPDKIFGNLVVPHNAVKEFWVWVNHAGWGIWRQSIDQWYELTAHPSRPLTSGHN